MAKTKDVQETVAVEEPIIEQATAPDAESVYTAEDLARNHKAFKAPREIVVVALRQAGKETATFAEAKSIIEKFRNKEVK